MFFSDQLLSGEGPLAYVWLAANLEKKLTKQQFLKTSIIESAKAIEDSTSGETETTGIPANNLQSYLYDEKNDEHEPMALRLSGQLLYGVVRIYSRKAKYLFDDVSFALLKIKSAFSTSQSVTLPPERTIIPSLQAVTLKDTVTEADLMYQGQLNMDEIFGNNVNENLDSRNSQLWSTTDLDSGAESTLGNRSIELPRRQENADELEGVEDFELPLDFDFEDENDENNNTDNIVPGISDFQLTAGADISLDFRRRADETNASVNENGRENESDIDMQDLEVHGFDLMNDNEIEANSSVDDIDLNEPKTPQADLYADVEVLDSDSDNENNKKLSGVKRRKQPKRINYEKEEVIRTQRRRLIIDDSTSIQIEEIRNTQNDIPQNFPRTIPPVSENKIDVIMKSTEPEFLRFIGSNWQSIKRRRLKTTDDIKLLENLEEFGLPKYGGHQIENPADQVLGFEQSKSSVTAPETEDNPELLFEDNNNADALEDFNNDFADVGNFDNEPAADNEDTGEEELEENFEDPKEQTKLTIKVADELRKIVGPEGGESNSQKEIKFGDLNSEHLLSSNPKKNATRTFFELLVLATSNAITLEQDGLFAEIKVQTSNTLFEKFV